MRTSPDAAIVRLALARAISVAGSLAAYTALIDLVFRRTQGSTIAVSITVLVTIGAVGIFSPFGGLIADRWDRKRAMIASDLTGAALFLVMALVEPVWLLLAVALLTAAASTPFRAGSMAAIPSLVGDESLIARANGRISIGSYFGIVLGPAVGGVLVGSIGAGPVFALNAVSFVASAALVWSIRAPFRDASDEKPVAGPTAGSMAGFRFLGRDRVLRAITVAWAVLHLGAGLVTVADRPVAEVFSVGSVGFGLMLGLYGIGAVLGGWLGTRLTAASEPVALVAGLVVAGVAGLAVGLTPLFAIVLAGSLVWGIGDAAISVARSGILQRRTPDALRGRVAGASESLLNLSLMAGFLLAGPVIAALGAQAAYALGGAAALLAAALSWTVIGAVRREADPAPATP